MKKRKEIQKRKNNKTKKIIENIFIKVLGFIVFTSPVILYCIACYLSSFVK